MIELVFNLMLTVTAVSDLHSTEYGFRNNIYFQESNPLGQSFEKRLALKTVQSVAFVYVFHKSERSEKRWVKWGMRGVAALLIGRQIKDTYENYRLGNKRYQ